MKGTIATTIVSAYAVTAGAERISGSRWVQATHQSAFVATPTPGSPTVSRHAGLPPTTTSQPSNKNGFFVQSKSRSRVTRVFATEEAVELKVDSNRDHFSCQNAFFFSSMCKTAYAPQEEVKSLFQGNETFTGLGFEHFHWFEAPKDVSEKKLCDPTQDTEAYVAANEDVVLAVFRGTSEAADWITNLEIIPRNVDDSWSFEGDGGFVHMGFDDGVNTVWHGDDGMLSKIKALLAEEGKERKLYVAGHSLGGALATIAGARLAFEHDIKLAGIYTIGSPRVFDLQLAAKFDDKMNHGTALKDKYFRCRNNNDIVPRVVPPPYAHVGTEVYLNRNGQIRRVTPWDLILGRYDSYKKLEFGDTIADHSASEYIRIFEKLALDEAGSG